MRHNDPMSTRASGAAEAAADDLPERLAALEAENERLRERLSAEPARPPGGVWRAWVSALCIVLAAVIAPVSIVTGWARVQLVDEDSFVATLAPLASDPAVQSMIIDQTMAAVDEKVDFAAITANAIDGIATLNLPPAAVSALTLLKQPAAAGLESIVERGVTRVVTSAAFGEVWATATRGAHRALTTAATSDGGGLVVRTADGVGIQLGAIVARVKQNLADQGVGAAAIIPDVGKVVILGSGENLALLRTGYGLATAVGWWLPVVALALFAAGVLVARRRATALLGVGVALLVGGTLLAVGFSVGAALVGTAATQLELPPTALGVIYAQLTAGMAHSAAIVAVLGGVLAAFAWVSGAWRPARAVRAGAGSINTGLRGALAARGVDTGAAGRWLYAQRVLVRAILAVVGILWLLALRPLTVGDVVTVLVVGLLAWWAAELAQQRPGEHEPAETLPSGSEPAPDAAEPPSA